MKVLLFGATGQLGVALQSSLPAGINIEPLTRAQCDLGDSVEVFKAIAESNADLVINAAAYTAVDQAEKEPAVVASINTNAPGAMAAACAAHGKRLVHISTDFVFGAVPPVPVPPDAVARPSSVYGRTKFAGERAVQAAMPDALILRTSWLYASTGSNFLRTMLRLMGERDHISVVADQIGTPTWANTLAQDLWRFVSLRAQGIFHVTDSGVASWYDFAVAIGEEAVAAGLLSHCPPISPIRTTEYPTPASRPAYSVLDKTTTNALLGRAAPHWRVSLRSAIAEISVHV